MTLSLHGWKTKHRWKNDETTTSNWRFCRKVSTLKAFSRKRLFTSFPMYDPVAAVRLLPAAHSRALWIGKIMGCGLKATWEVSGRYQYESTPWLRRAPGTCAQSTVFLNEKIWCGISWTSWTRPFHRCAQIGGHNWLPVPPYIVAIKKKKESGDRKFESRVSESRAVSESDFINFNVPFTSNSSCGTLTDEVRHDRNCSSRTFYVDV